MSQNGTIEIEDLKRIRLDPGDVLLVRLKKAVDASDLARIESRLSQMLQNNDSIVINGNADFAVIRTCRGGCDE